MAKDEYAFVPSEEFAKVEKELDRIKHSPVLAKDNSSQLAQSMSELHGAVTNLYKLFEKANEDLTLEQREERIIQQQLKPVLDRLHEIADQNETIANGIVTVAEHINELKTDIATLKQQRAAQPAARQTYTAPPPPPHTTHSVPPLQPDALNEKHSLFKK